MVKRTGRARRRGAVGAGSPPSPITGAALPRPAVARRRDAAPIGQFHPASAIVRDLEDVTRPALRLDPARVLRLVLDLLAEPGDVVVDGTGRREDVVAPDVVQQRLARQHFAPVLDEVRQDPELARRELEIAPALRHPLPL